MLEDNAFLPDSYTTAAPLTMAAAIDQEADLPATGRYTLLHLLVPHVPFVLDADCRTRAVTEPVEQSACAMSWWVRTCSTSWSGWTGSRIRTIVIQLVTTGRNFELLDGELLALPDEREEHRCGSKPVRRPRPAHQAVGRSARLPPRGRTSTPPRWSTCSATIFDSVGSRARGGRGHRTSLLHEPLPARSVRYFHFYAVNVD